LEYVAGGSLRDILKKFGPLDEKLTKIYIRQILEGLLYLHQNKVVHRDLKCANILLSSDGEVKLSDFGASKKLERELNFVEAEKEISKSVKGSPYWMAPEMVRQVGHDFRADIWSLGCVIIEMLTGQPPFYSTTDSVRQVLRNLKKITKGPEYPKNITRSCVKFLDCCLQVNPIYRLPVDELMRQKWIVEGSEEEKALKTQLEEQKQ